MNQQSKVNYLSFSQREAFPPRPRYQIPPSKLDVPMTRPCTSCGQRFTSAPTGGRPRSRCDQCRTNHDKIDGKRWRTIRIRVLAQQPICASPGCGKPATQVDHIRPLAAGGAPYDLSNLQGMCGPHNASKGAKLEVIYEDPTWCTHPNCTEPETCGGPNAHWHL